MLLPLFCCEDAGSDGDLAGLRSSHSVGLTLCFDGSITHACFSSCSVPTNLYVPVKHLPTLWALPGSRQTPFLRWGTMHAKRRMVELFTCLLFFPRWSRQHYLLVTTASDTALLVLPAFLAADMEKYFELKGIWGCWCIFYTPWGTLSLSIKVSAEQMPCPFWTVQPMNLSCHKWSETTGLFTKKLSHRWEKLAWELHSYVCSCKPVQLAAYQLPLHMTQAGPSCPFVCLAWS